jgi:hypothetical protein
MAAENGRLEELKAENSRLKAENRKLREGVSKGVQAPHKSSSFWKRLASILLICLATALLVVGNILFWTGNTIVKTDRFVAATEPLIKNSEVQNALANRISLRLFKNVDVEQTVASVLPPRADFLAPAIATQVEQQTDTVIKKVLQRPQFQERWNTIQARAHDRFISSVERNGSDGSIDLSEVYSDASQQLKSTKLAFLADKPLPARVGSIEIASGEWLTILQKTIQNIDTWRFFTILLLVIFSVLGVWLSRNRRRSVIFLGSLFAASMFVTLLSIRLAREILANKAGSQYSEATRQAYSIVVHSFAIQTLTIMVAAILVAIVAWISGDYASSRALRLKINQLLSGRLHEALFHRENGFTLWIGRNKTWLQWLIVALVALSTLIVRLTPGTLLVQVIILILAILIIEILAAKPVPAVAKR